jgi:hypothetical protein
MDGSEHNRKLQRGDDGDAFADFILFTSLNLPFSDVKDEQNDRIPVLMFVGAVLLLGLLVSYYCCGIIRCFGCLPGRECWKHEQVEVHMKSELPPELDPSNAKQ